jgi:hypothetical protein
MDCFWAKFFDKLRMCVCVCVVLGAEWRFQLLFGMECRECYAAITLYS